MALVFSVPGKTFLAGEYLALDGGLTLTAMTEPRFEVVVKSGTGQVVNIPSGSPADRLIQRNAEFFSKLDVSFNDPHGGQGGWGASTAQYLGLFALLSWKNSANDESVQELDTRELLESYRGDAWNGEGRAPSGADLIGQLKGSCTFFEKNSGLISRAAWPFPQLEGVIIRTGVKVPTHEHLRTLTDIPSEELAPVMARVREMWTAADAEGFAEALSDYGRVLRMNKLCVESTLEILHDLSWLNGVKAAKGCGALGADVVFALIEKNSKKSFELWAQEKELDIVFLTEKISHGLDLKVESTVDLRESQQEGSL